MSFLFCKVVHILKKCLIYNDFDGMRIEGQGSNYDDALFTNYKDILNLLMFRRNSIITAGLPDMDKLNGVLVGLKVIYY